MNTFPRLFVKLGAQRGVILMAAAISIAMTVSLGGWQLRRAALKEQLAAQISERNALPALENTALNASHFVAATRDEATWLQRRASLQGRWLHEYTVFLDNRSMQVGGSQRVGFYVATPLAIDAGNRVIWVQRGWVPRDFLDRSKLPVLSEDGQLVIVQGRLIANVSKAFEMKSDARDSVAAPSESQTSASSRPSRIWQNLPILSLGSNELLPMAVLQTAPEVEKDMLLRAWPAADSGMAKHYGYAFQWFALSALISVLYVWFQLIAPRRRAKSKNP